MTEYITKVSKIVERQDDNTVHKLIIQTLKDNKKWEAFIAIHIPNYNNCRVGAISVNPPFFCDTTLNSCNVIDYSKLVGRKILRKEQLQFDDHMEELPMNSKSHLTKLIFYLEKTNDNFEADPYLDDDEKELCKMYDILSLKIGDLYDATVSDGCLHTGGDTGVTNCEI